MNKAKMALFKRLNVEADEYDLPTATAIQGEEIHYNGKGERFEFRVTFIDGQIKTYEVTVYGNGRSFKVYEI